jgi:misacylated tRNA(Ala) deacylase
MKTLYLLDCYMKEFETTIKSVNEKFVTLEETAFYPNSGGQPNDTGKINDYNVVYVGKFKGEISQEVDKEGLKPGDKVKCTIDWDRRYKLMRYHTAAHILANVINKNTGAMITGNQLSLEKARIDFCVEDYNPEELQNYVNEANEIVKRELPVKLSIISREEAIKNLGENISMLAKGLPESVKEIRIVKIEGYTEEACGGTHVANTKEVGPLTFLKSQNKGKNNRRVYFSLD